MRTPSAVGGLEPLDRRVEGNNPTVVLEVAGERQHEAVAVDNAGLGRMERGDAEQCRLHALRFGCFQHGDVLDAVGERLGVDRLEPKELVGVGRNHQLAALPVWHAVAGAKLVQHAAPGRAVAGAQRTRGIIKAGMDHFAVA